MNLRSIIPWKKEERSLARGRGDGDPFAEEEEGDYYRSERSYGYFDRTIALPQGIDADNAKAKFKKGVLKVTIPKKPEAQSSRRKIELTEG